MKAILIVLVLILSFIPAPAQAIEFTHFEQRVQYQINQARENRGLIRLRYDSCADSRAERWALHLKETGTLYHQPLNSIVDSCRATYAGEVLALGSMMPKKMVRMWLLSPLHREVILDSRPRRIGVGVRYHPDGGRVTVVNVLRR